MSDMQQQAKENAMALILKGSTWWLDTRIDGHRVRRSTGKKSRREANQIAKMIEAKLRGFQYVPKSREGPSLALAFDIWTSYAKAHRLRPRTIEQAAHVKTHFLRYFDGESPAALTTERIEAYKADHAHHSPSTVNSRLVWLRTILRRAKVTPLPEFQLLPVELDTPDVFDREELQR